MVVMESDRKTCGTEKGTDCSSSTWVRGQKLLEGCYVSKLNISSFLVVDLKLQTAQLFISQTKSLRDIYLS